MPSVPIHYVRARAVIIHQNHLLLVNTTDNNRSFYFLPGGGIELGETAEQCLRREMQEELNIANDRIHDVNPLVVHEYAFHYQGQLIQEYMLIHTMRIDGLDHRVDVPSCEPHLTTRWQPLDQLDQILILPHTHGKQLNQWLKTSHRPLFVSDIDLLNN